MGSLLVENPEKYIINYLGTKNREELEIAMEIYLAEKVFDPKFIGNGFSDIRSIDQNAQRNYKKEYLVETTPLYYFHYMKFVYINICDQQDLYEKYGVYVAEKVLRKNKLTSQVANWLLKSNDFYNSVHQDKIDGIRDSDSLRKVMGLITLQNKELYRLEMKRMKNMREYHIYEKYLDDLIVAEKEVFQQVVC